MKTSASGIDLIKGFESCKTSAYQDIKGVWTIGYGHIAGVQAGDTCTEAQAKSWLDDDLGDAEGLVSHFVKIPLNQHQFDALVSFTFNVGGGALQASTLLHKLNAGDIDGAADEFDRWDHAGKIEVAGLLRRREAETQEFKDPVESVTIVPIDLASDGSAPMDEDNGLASNA